MASNRLEKSQGNQKRQCSEIFYNFKIAGFLGVGNRESSNGYSVRFGKVLERDRGDGRTV